MTTEVTTKNDNGKDLCCMTVKKDTETEDLFGVFFIYSALGCATGLINAKIVGLLTNPNYRLEDVRDLAEPAWDPNAENAQEIELAQVSDTMQDMIRNQLFVATGLAIFMGWAYDVFGRQGTIILGLLGMTVFMTLMPTFGESMSGLYAGRILFGIFTHLVLYNPLIQDFVKPKSRGMGYALTICGSILGLLLSYWLSTYHYTPATEDEEAIGLTIRKQFLVYGVMVTILSVLGLVLIKEPPQVRLVDPSKKGHET